MKAKAKPGLLVHDTDDRGNNLCDGRKRGHVTGFCSMPNCDGTWAYDHHRVLTCEACVAVKAALGGGK